MRPAETKHDKARLPAAAERRVWLARLALAYERLWPRTWVALAVILIFLGLSWFEAFRAVPGYLHALALLVFVGTAGFALYRGLKGFSPPTREEALARIETDSGFAHRPLQTLGDTLAMGRSDPVSQALWRAHLARASAILERMRLRGPRPDIPRADPYALRVFIVTFALLGLLNAGPDWRQRIGAALTPNLAPEAAHNIIVDAWVTPPPYTGAPAIFLTALKTASGPVRVSAPVGSVLTVRVTGVTRAPQLKQLTRSAQLPDDWHVRVPLKPEAAGAFKLDLPLEVTETIELIAGRRLLNRWTIALAADIPPAISLRDPLSITEKDTIALHYVASDDYGVAKAEMRLALAQPIPTTSGEAGASIMPVPPLVIALTLPPAKTKSVDAREFLDLAASPWAGRDVRLGLRATDEAGQTGDSAPVLFKLPVREFHDPLARSLIEQRRLLAEAPRANRDHVRRALDALALAPERFKPDAVTYLGLRSAFFRLGQPLNSQTVQSVYDLLWQMALHIEDGDLSLAEVALRDAQKRLAEVLAGNAPDAEIQSAMSDLKRALARYLQALSEAARKAQARGETPPGVGPNGEVLTAEDLSDMLKAIENMSQTGARGEARQLLSQLQSLLENLQIGGGGMSQQESTMSQGLDQLSKIVEDQRSLLDETYRKSGIGGGPRPKDRSVNALARDQAELGERLDQLKKGLAQAAPKGLEPLNKAGKSMGDAVDALSANKSEEAVAPETRAIEALQQGMQNLAQALSQSMGGRMANEGSNGRDPLGRRNGPGAMDQDGVKVPSEMALQRARKILEELQKRASDPTRQQKELEYLDRLLKRF